MSDILNLESFAEEFFNLKSISNKKMEKVAMKNSAIHHRKPIRLNFFVISVILCVSFLRVSYADDNGPEMDTPPPYVPSNPVMTQAEGGTGETQI